MKKRTNWTGVYQEAITQKFIYDEYRRWYKVRIDPDGVLRYDLNAEFPKFLYSWEFRIGGGARADFAKLDEDKGWLQLFEVKTTHERPNVRLLARQLENYATVASHVWFVCDRTQLLRWGAGVPPYAGVVLGDEDDGKFVNLQVYQEAQYSMKFDAKKLVGTLNTKEIAELLEPYSPGLPAWKRPDELASVMREESEKEIVPEGQRLLTWKKKAAQAICRHRHQYQSYLRANH